MNETTDIELVRRAQSGDPGGFEELMKAYQARLRGFVARYIQDPDDVFDIVQDTFMRAYEHLERLDPARSFYPWARTICRNCTFNFMRDRKRHQLMAAAPATTEALAELVKRGGGSGEDEHIEERLEALRLCAEGLPEGSRGMIERRYREGVSLKTMAQKTKKTVAAVSIALKRIRERLFDCMEDRLKRLEA